jgi:ABC-type thiamine transport system ATPase subunit
MTIDPTLNAKLDQLIGKVDGLQGQTQLMHSETNKQLDVLKERMALVETGVTSTREVVDAWGAAKTSLRFVKWLAGMIAVLISIVVALKTGLPR